MPFRHYGVLLIFVYAGHAMLYLATKRGFRLSRMTPVILVMLNESSLFLNFGLAKSKMKKNLIKS